MKTSSTEATSVNNCVTILLLTTFAKPTTLQTMIHFNHKLFILCILLCFAGKTGWGQLQVDTLVTPEQLVHKLLGQGVEVSNIEYHGNGVSKGIFRNGRSTELQIDSGVLLTTGSNHLVPGNASGPNMSTVLAWPPSGLDNDPDLNSILGHVGKDATVLEFDFIPLYDEIRISYRFASEEYPEFACQNYNDIFAFFLTSLSTIGIQYNKKNIALLPDGATYVGINTVNDLPYPTGTCTNNNFQEYYIDNQSGLFIVFDGMTVTLEAFAVVTPCQPYHIKIAIEEDGDEGGWDSGVFLEAGSFSSPGVALEPIYTTPGDEPFAVEGCTQANLKITLPFANPVTSWVVFDSITGTATNGVDYNLLNDSVMFLPNQLSVTIPIVPVYDGLAEGDENIFIYLSNQVGCAGTNLQRTEIVLHDFTPVEIGSDTAVCEGTQVTFDAGEGYKSYTWHDGSHGDTWTSPGTPSVTLVSVSILDNYGCPSSDALQLTTYQQPAQNPIKHQ